jgi:general secretion pathway protein K
MEVKATTNDVDLKQSYYIARSGVFYSIARILLSKPQTATAEPQQPVDEEVERGKLHFEMANGAAEVAIFDESGKINANYASEEILRHLMSEVGLQPDVGDAIVDSILDWRDPDKDVHLNGAEDDYYMSLPEPYHIKDGPLDSVEELLLVKGITPEIFYGQKFKDESGAEINRGGLTNFLTVYAPYNRININSAPLEVLASLPGMNRQKAQMIVSRRTEKPFSSPTEVGETIGLGDMNALGYLSTFRTPVYSLRSVGRLNGRKIISVIRCTFSLDGVSPTGYRMIYWNENNLEL